MQLRLTRGGVGLLAVLALGAPALAMPSAGASEANHPSVVSDIPANWTPHLRPDGTTDRPVAYSITRAGDLMVVGGNFTSVENSSRTTSFARRHVFAFNATSGAVSGFAPQLNGQVWSVLGSGSTVYVGGEFTTVNGQPRAALAKLNLATGQLDPTFKPPMTSGRVTDLELSHGQLIVGGSFRKKLMSLNPTTGKATGYLNVPITDPLPFTSRTEVFRFDVSPNGQRLVAVGNFTEVAGDDNWRIFMLDLGATSAVKSDWNYSHSSRACHAQTTPKFQMYVRDVDFAPDSSYFAVAATGGHRINGEGPGLVLCDSVARFETGVLSPSVPTWINYTGGDSLHAVQATGAAVYVQGHNRWLDNPYGRDFAGPGAVDRKGGGAVDPNTGEALPWNPVMPQQKGGYQILATGAGLWFVTDGIRFKQRHRYGIRFVPLP